MFGNYKSGCNIKYYRKRANLLQKEFASILNIQVYQLSFIENSKMYPDPKLLDKIAIALGVTVVRLYEPEELEFILINKGGISARDIQD